MRRFIFILTLSYSTEPVDEFLDWMKGIPYSASGDDESYGYLSDFGANVGLEDVPCPVVHATVPLGGSPIQNPATPLPARPATASVSGIPSKPRRPKVVKRSRSDYSSESADSSSIGHNKIARGGSAGALGRLDQGRAFALLAANPDISKFDFIASLINVNPDLDKMGVKYFYYNCQKRTRFPTFVRDYLDTHRYHLDTVVSPDPLRAELKPLFLAAGLRRGDQVPAKAVRMWGKLVLAGPGCHTTDTTRGVEYLRLSREAQVALFTQLWIESGSPPITPVSVAPPTPHPSPEKTLLSDTDRVAAMELLAAYPSWGMADLVGAFLKAHPGRFGTTVRTMFKRYRGWTTVPLWMHETLCRNAHLAATPASMRDLRVLVLEEAQKVNRGFPNTRVEYITDWIKYCVPPVPGAPEPCEHHITRGGVFVRMPEDMQRDFFATKRSELVARPSKGQGTHGQ